MNAFRAVMLRDLAAVRAELAAYDTDEQLWELPAGLPNPAGSLALHLAGNIQHFIGAALGGTDYVRDRDGEFGRRGVSRQELDEQLAAAHQVVDQVLAGITDDQLAAPFPVALGGVTLRTDVALAHLAGHLTYHLGQLDYHRRVVTGNADGVGAVSPKQLA